MALPKLEVPSYELELPSTGKKVKYRPFLVKEHKILLTLVESDLPEVARGVTELVDVCTFKQLDIDKLSHFDVEYIFLQLRAKSLGESVDLVVNCPCGAKVPHTVSLNDVKVVKTPDFTNKLKITDTVGIVMRYPKFEEITRLYDGEFKADVIFDVVKLCIESVYDDQDVYDKSSYTSEELDEFLNSLSKQQFEKIEKYFTDMPKIVQPIEADCPECGKHNSLTLEGLQNFFV